MIIWYDPTSKKQRREEEREKEEKDVKRLKTILKDRDDNMVWLYYPASDHLT